MKFKELRRDVSGGLFVASMVTAALVGIFFAGWKIAGLPFVPFDSFDWLTRVLPGRVLGFGIGIMVEVIRELHLGPTSETAKTAEHAIAIAGLFVMGVTGGTILFSILRTRRKVHPVFLGLVLGIVLAVPAMLISVHVSETATVDQALRAAWILVAFLAWGVILGRVGQQLIGTETANSTVESATEPRVKRIDRRHFLVKLGGSAAAITVVGALVGEFAESRRKESAMMAASKPIRWSATRPLPNAAAAVKPAPGTRPEFTSLENHYRIDINAIPPKVDEQRWRLKTTGLVEQPLSLTLEQLRGYEPMHPFVTLSCISNPVGGDLIGTTRWTGVSLQRLLPDLRLQPTATHLKIRSADEFFEVVALDAVKADERIMLTYAWDGVPLRREHGFPLRIYIPDVHGMKQPKWIESIEFTDHWEPGFWVVRGWNKVAQMHATSVIDTVAVDMTIIGTDKRKLVPIGGMAHAGDRGISKVEVQVDSGPWEEALIRTPLSQLTWVLWRYDWPFRPGKHTFTVRCYDGNGTLQIAAPSPPEPDGATGLSSRSVML
ncbi:MAG TPA: molybdopterin-dependent oxidoreductase [Candidatus Polarisedimenticolia bacterium]|nr:molybdopterin-dependent oxidoreductase [Candidatus Polarisedimenticolia bacterium]